MPLSDNLIAYWSLGEASGNAIDAHSTHDLTETGGTIASAAGKVGNCRDFEADNADYFNIASNGDLEFGDVNFSGQAWIRLETNGVRQVVLAKDIDTPASSRDFGLIITSGNAAQFYINGSQEGVVDWGSTLSTATWYHVCFGHSASANEVWITVNGGTPVTFATSGAAVSSASSPFRIGARAYSGFEDYFDGLIDEVGLWERDIRTDVAALYNGGSGISYDDIAGTPAASTGGAFPRWRSVRR
jgi:hypothetical protein